jgi:hypothetical protein
MSLAVSSNWLSNFAVGLVTPKLLDRIQYATYLFYAAWNVIAFFVVYIWFVETKGKSLEEVDLMFDDGCAEDKVIIEKIKAHHTHQDDHEQQHYFEKPKQHATEHIENI